MRHVQRRAAAAAEPADATSRAGHGPPVESGGEGKVRQYIEHREARVQQVAAALQPPTGPGLTLEAVTEVRTACGACVRRARPRAAHKAVYPAIAPALRTGAQGNTRIVLQHLAAIGPSPPRGMQGQPPPTRSAGRATCEGRRWWAAGSTKARI